MNIIYDGDDDVDDDGHDDQNDYDYVKNIQKVIILLSRK